MTATTTDRPLSLIALALIGVGLVGLLDAATGSGLGGGLHVGWSIGLLPVGVGLLAGHVGWIRPLLRVMQIGAVLTAALVVASAFAPEVPFLIEGTEVGGGGRMVMAALAVAEAGVWVWVLGLARRWTELELSA